MLALLVGGAVTYAVLGIVFALAFAWRGVVSIDPVARGSTIGFRLIVMPGAAVLWPWLAVRWWRTSSSGVVVPGERTEDWQGPSERLRLRAWVMWIVLAPIIALLLAVALRSRAPNPPESLDAARLPDPTAGVNP